MNTYTADYFKRRNAESRSENTLSVRSFPICPALSLPCVPFRLWALIVHQVNDVMAVKPYRRACLWTEYRLDMVYMGFLWETSRNFGLSED